MGIPGLFGYLKRNGLTRQVDIYEKIQTWKKRNAGKTPIIVIDFKNFTYCVANKLDDAVCGGRHQIILESWEEILRALKTTGSDLVFFSDLNTTTNKMESWMESQDEQFLHFVNFYKSIEVNGRFDEVLHYIQDIKPPNATFYDMAALARKYGEIYFTVRRENDFDLAQYATYNDAVAVISNDTDFLIFPGPWSLWSSDGMVSHSFTVTEFSRDGLLQKLNLTRDQMPLFATAKGNDFTKEIFPPTLRRIHEAADFVRKFDSTASVKDIFPDCSDSDLKLIQYSLESYDISVNPMPIEDPIEKILFETKNKMYRFYMALTNPIQGIALLWYDMKEDNNEINLSELLVTWSKRKVGILHAHKHKNDESHTFTILTKRDANEPFSDFLKTPDYPDFPVPPLDELYSTDTAHHIDSIETKWERFGWIMSFTESEIKTIRNLKKEFRLICAILCALFKEKLLSEIEACGILCTEYKVFKSKLIETAYPDVLDAQYVRAAHKYNIAFSHVRENFAVAGLLSEIQEVLQFDGVYFQSLMCKLEASTPEKSQRFVGSVKAYVLSSDEIEFNLF